MAASPFDQSEPGQQASPRALRALIVWFLLLIGVVPLVQLASELSRGEPVQELDVLRSKPTLEGLQSYERALEDNSVVAQAVRGRWHWLSLRALRAGNQKAVVAREGALFFRTSLDATLQPGFMSAPDGDGHPVAAITAFNEALKTRGVQLVLLVVPGKEAIYPEWLSARYPPSAGPAVNADMPEFFEAMRARGITVVDPANALWQAKQRAPMFLRLDTHWTPEGMALVADELVRHLPELAAGDLSLTTQPQQVTGHGDLYGMLGLAPDLPPPLPTETVTVQRVIDARTGLPIEPDTSSPITLLGDSFTNIYSVPQMNWGDHAGLGEHLGLRLGRAVDIIALNDGGVNTARMNMARRRDPLADKQVVIWQFAARDLVVSNGQWQEIQFPPEKR